MSRFKASLLHLLMSALIIGTVVGVVISLWYPLSLLHVSGIDGLIMLIAMVDLTAGPLLTLVVYKHGKRGLKLDLALIGIVQLALLSYGIWVLSQNRPVFMVASVDRFEQVRAIDIDAKDLALAKPPYDRLSWTGAEVVGAVLPRGNPELMNEILFGRDVHVQPRHYVPYAQVRGELLTRAKTLDRLLGRRTPEERALLTEAMQGAAQEKIRYLPLNTGVGSATVLVSAETGDIIDVVPVDPW